MSFNVFSEEAILCSFNHFIRRGLLTKAIFVKPFRCHFHFLRDKIRRSTQLHHLRRVEEDWLVLVVLLAVVRRHLVDVAVVVVEDVELESAVQSPEELVVGVHLNPLSRGHALLLTLRGREALGGLNGRQRSAHTHLEPGTHGCKNRSSWL